MYRKDAVFESGLRKRSQKRTGNEQQAQILNGQDESLLTALKKLRLDIARKQGVPAFVIFSDRTLIDMVNRKPRDMAEFALVNGVGAVKLQKLVRSFSGNSQRLLEQKSHELKGWIHLRAFMHIMIAHKSTNNFKVLFVIRKTRFDS